MKLKLPIKNMIINMSHASDSNYGSFRKITRITKNIIQYASFCGRDNSFRRIGSFKYDLNQTYNKLFENPGLWKIESVTKS